MSIPRTNLEDLKRKAESATPPVSSQPRSKENAPTNKVGCPNRLQYL